MASRSKKQTTMPAYITELASGQKFKRVAYNTYECETTGRKILPAEFEELVKKEGSGFVFSDSSAVADSNSLRVNLAFFRLTLFEARPDLYRLDDKAKKKSREP